MVFSTGEEIFGPDEEDLKAPVTLAVAAMLLGSQAWPAPANPPALVGFSYSPLTSEQEDRDPAADLGTLLTATDPDLVRLPVYWEDVEPAPDVLNFSSIDDLLQVVQSHDATATRPTRVVLVIGARNFLYPELHEPAWAGARTQPDLGLAQSSASYRAYLEATLVRYRASPLLYAWQVENEPFDEVGNDVTGDDQISAQQLSWEIDEAHHLDPRHDVVVTTYDGWNVAVDMLQANAPGLLADLRAGPSGHPEQALAAGDALGLDIYVEGPPVPLGFTNIDLRSTWKQQAIDYWAGQARARGKDVWLAEMQAQSWGTTTAFQPANLVASAVDYRQEPLGVILLWGVETWLRDPAWMAAATRAIEILRSPAS